MRNCQILPLLALAFGAIAVPALADTQMSEAWPSLRAEIFNTRPIVQDDGVVTLQAPERAEDAALVPISIELKDPVHSPLRRVTLIVDENPAPIAAVVSFGDQQASPVQALATRVRVDRYSYIRAIAETADGQLHMAARFVKASGGCSAPASKDAELALQDLGKMQVSTRRVDNSATPSEVETKIMIRHPNFSGLQIDELTRGYRPAHFLRNIDVHQGNQLLMSIEAAFQFPKIRTSSLCMIGRMRIRSRSSPAIAKAMNSRVAPINPVPDASASRDFLHVRV